jgi:HSP20 family protein
MWADPFVDDYKSSFLPLFYLLDDFDTYARETTGKGPGRRHRGHRERTISPRFDVRDLPEGYELYGELPGVDQKDVEIEFTDPQTLAIRGRIERPYTLPCNICGSQSTGGAITEGGEQQQQSTTQNGSATSKSGTQLDTRDQNKQDQQDKDQVKFLVAERRTGEFSRSFNFTEPIDQDGVKANMKNGILRTWVPKAKKPASRKVQISSS